MTREAGGCGVGGCGCLTSHGGTYVCLVSGSRLLLMSTNPLVPPVLLAFLESITLTHRVQCWNSLVVHGRATSPLQTAQACVHGCTAYAANPCLSVAALDMLGTERVVARGLCETNFRSMHNI